MNLIDNQKKVKESYVLKFFIIVLSIIIVYSIIGFCWLYFYLKNISHSVYDPSMQNDISIENESILIQKESENINESDENDGILSNFLTPPPRTNFLIAGVDKNKSLTDCIIAGSFVSETNEINLISIPRDTYVELESDKLKKMKNAPSVMKINAVNVYGGKKYGMELLKSEVEEILDINIDYYVKVDLDAFKNIVDAVGGIYFEVPSGGLYYSDPTQNLYINLRGGYQLLNGKQAEGLVRFRKGYSQQDLKRVEVQQEFLKEFLKQAFTKENLGNNIITLVSNYIKYVDTNFSVEDIPKYLKCINSLNTDNISSTTLPGYADMIDGASYYIKDNAKTKRVVEQYFYSTSSETTENETTENETLDK